MDLLRRYPRSCLRLGLRAVQRAAVALANYPRQADRPYLRFRSWDLLVAHRLAQSLVDDDSILDIGCGNGHRLYELGFFRQFPRRHGVDLSITPETCDGVTLQAFDGEHLTFDDSEFDVTLLCYVLHHLTPEHADRLFAEAARVTRRTIFLLEDSRPSWGPWYRLRNWCHRLDADLEYGGSQGYRSPRGQSMFLTHDEWQTRLGKLAIVKSITVEPLYPTMKYRHHTLFRIELTTPHVARTKRVA